MNLSLHAVCLYAQYHAGAARQSVAPKGGWLLRQGARLLEREDAVCGQRHARPRLAHAPEGVQEGRQEERRAHCCLPPVHLPCASTQLRCLMPFMRVWVAGTW